MGTTPRHNSSSGVRMEGVGPVKGKRVPDAQTRQSSQLPTKTRTCEEPHQDLNSTPTPGLRAHALRPVCIFFKSNQIFPCCTIRAPARLWRELYNAGQKPKLKNRGRLQKQTAPTSR